MSTLQTRSSSAIFSLVSGDSGDELDEEADDMMKEALEVEYVASKANKSKRKQTDSVGTGESDEGEVEDLDDSESDGHEGSSSDSVGDDEEQEDSISFEDDGGMLDAGLAAAQDSVKTVITQSFRACAFAADSVASLVLKAHEYKSAEDAPAEKVSPKEQSAGASSSETRMVKTDMSLQVPRGIQPCEIPTVDSTTKSSADVVLRSSSDADTDGAVDDDDGDVLGELPCETAIEKEEKRINLRQQQQARAMNPNFYPNVSSEAFAALFQDLDDSTLTFGSNPTPPHRLPSDFQLYLNSSSSENELGELANNLPEQEEDAPPSDSDTYTELSQVEKRGKLIAQNDTAQQTVGEPGILQVSVRTISDKLVHPIHLASSLFFHKKKSAVDDGVSSIGVISPAESERWGTSGYLSPTHSPYYFTPPITPFGNIRSGQPLRGLRTSFRKVSLGSFNSIKDAISSWRHSSQPVHSAEPVPNATTQQSGLFEDIEMFLLERVDLTFYAARHLVKRIKRKRFFILKRRCGPRSLDDAAEEDKLDISGASHDKDFLLPDEPKKHGSGAKPKGRISKKKSKSACSDWRSIFSWNMPSRAVSGIKKGLSSILLSPFSFLDSATRRFVHLENVDELKGIGNIVHRQGYPFQELRVVTNDGYVLTLDRLPNPGSKKVAMLVHGVMDSSFTYICNGSDSSLAYRLHDEGYDVYLTNFRGVGGSMAHRHVRPNISEEEFWDFSINEHAFEDIPTFVRAIVRTKMSEFSSNNDFTSKPSILAVAHSMGGAVMLMYVLNQREQKLRHYIDGLVLVSPAGIHSESPIYARVGGRVVDLTVAKLVNSLRLPTDALTRATVKIVQDIKNSVPALEDIISLVVVYALGGDKNQPRRGPFSAVQQLTYNILTCGTSTKVYTHLRQLIASHQFRAFDYEPKAYPSHFSSKKGGNMEHYGTPEPPEYTSRYHMLDLPVHLIAGLDDQLIGPNNILRHYEAMKRHGVDVTFESFERCGHADFTCGLHSKALQGILVAVDRVMNKILSKNTTLKELQRKNLITPHFTFSQS